MVTAVGAAEGVGWALRGRWDAGVVGKSDESGVGEEDGDGVAPGWGGGGREGLKSVSRLVS